MVRLLIALVVGTVLGVAGLLPASMHTDNCSFYKYEYENPERVRDPINPYGMMQCEPRGLDGRDFIYTFYVLGLPALGLLLAARIARRHYVLVAAAVAVLSGFTAGIGGMLLSKLPLSILLRDPAFYFVLCVLTVVGGVFGYVLQRKSI